MSNLTTVLALHLDVSDHENAGPYLCLCGTVLKPGPEEAPREAHRRHLARAIRREARMIYADDVLQLARRVASRAVPPLPDNTHDQRLVGDTLRRVANDLDDLVIRSLTAEGQKCPLCGEGRMDRAEPHVLVCSSNCGWAEDV